MSRGVSNAELLEPVIRTPLRTSTAAVTVCAGLVLALAPAAHAAVPARSTAPGVLALAAATSSQSSLQLGSRGTQVRQWQALLNRIFREGAVTGRTVAEDGVFGRATDRATRTVQAHLRLTQDGVVGPRTRSAVSELGFATGVGGTSPSTDADHGDRRLRTGMSGADVREWQRIVDIAIDLGRLDHARLTQDGQFGRQTHDATVTLQRTLKVTADGVVGPVTREAAGWLLEG